MNLANITLHGRTLKQQYSGLANWDFIGQAAALIKQTDTLVLGNGDVASKADALEKIKTYGVDGVLIGRASMGDPYIFSDSTPTDTNIYTVALEHCRIFEETYSHEESYTFLPMRKHLGWYVKSVPFASEIRIKLFQTNTSNDVYEVFKSYGLVN
jgi:tRNA-dihydrouridine synthase